MSRVEITTPRGSFGRGVIRFEMEGRLQLAFHPRIVRDWRLGMKKFSQNDKKNRGGVFGGFWFFFKQACVGHPRRKREHKQLSNT